MSRLENNRDKIVELQHEIKMIERFVTPLDKLDIDVNWVKGVKKQNGLLSCTVNSLERFNQILEVYPTCDVDAVLGFAGRADQETYSPFTIECSNWSLEYPIKKASIRYMSDEIEIWCDVPLTEFKEFLTSTEVTDVRRVRGQIRTHVVGHHTFISSSSGLTNMVYSGGSKTSNSYKLYAKDSTQRSAMDKLLKVRR